MQKYKTIVTNHAAERFVQRTRLLGKFEFASNPKRYISYFVENGVREPRLDLYPFYRNKMGVTHVVKYGNFKFYMVGNKVVTFVLEKGEGNWRF